MGRLEEIWFGEEGGKRRAAARKQFGVGILDQIWFGEEEAKRRTIRRRKEDRDRFQAEYQRGHRDIRKVVRAAFTAGPRHPVRDQAWGLGDQIVMDVLDLYEERDGYGGYWTEKLMMQQAEEYVSALAPHTIDPDMVVEEIRKYHSA